MRDFYPHLEPYTSGMLDVGDGHQLCWEESGNPNGKPVVFLHGGPGAGSGPKNRRTFDPQRYRIVLFDQRGCGRSTPHASKATRPEDLATNTTWHLVDDLERLRVARGIEQWQVFGGSWGSGLALAYAQTHPERVTELLLRGIFTARTLELDWLYEGGAAHIAPERWEHYVAPVGDPAGRSYIDTFHDLLWDAAPEVHSPAAIAWSTWAASVLTLLPRQDLVAAFSEPRTALAFARLENHYFRHRAWLEDDQLLRDAHRLAGIPTTIIHGRYDLSTPVISAYELKKRMPHADLIIVENAGHSYEEPGILSALIEATDRYAGHVAASPRPARLPW